MLGGGTLIKSAISFLICVSGHVTVMLDDGKKRVATRLDRPSLGLHIRPGIWGYWGVNWPK